MIETKEGLECRWCNHSISPQYILETSRTCSPRLSVLYVDCPHCGKRLQVEAQPNRLSIGGIDGFPGPCFIQESTQEVPGLSVSIEKGDESMKLSLDNLCVEIPSFCQSRKEEKVEPPRSCELIELLKIFNPFG